MTRSDDQVSEPAPTVPTLTSLQDLRWQHRILVGRIDDAALLERLEQSLDATGEERRDRRLLCIIAHRRRIRIWSDDPLTAQDNIGAEIDAVLEGASDALALIGLDGGVKHTYRPARSELEWVFSHIDAMPMRLAEQRRPRDRP